MSWYCEVSGCNFGVDGQPWATPSSLDSDRQRIDSLSLHVKMKHELGDKVKETKPEVKEVASKLTEKYVRPTLDDKCSEKDFRFFKYQWNTNHKKKYH